MALNWIICTQYINQYEIEWVFTFTHWFCGYEDRNAETIWSAAALSSSLHFIIAIHFNSRHIVFDVTVVFIYTQLQVIIPIFFLSHFSYTSSAIRINASCLLLVSNHKCAIHRTNEERHKQNTSGFASFISSYLYISIDFCAKICQLMPCLTNYTSQSWLQQQQQH